MNTTGTGSLPDVTKEFVGAPEASDQDACRLRRLVNGIEASQLAPGVCGLVLGFLLFITLFGVTGPFLHDIFANVSSGATFLIGACTPLLLIIVSTIGFKVSVYDERRDHKIEELGSLMSLVDPCYRNALMRLKESDPSLAKKITKFTKWHKAKEASK